MWTEAHRARHEPRLKAVVAAHAVEEVAAWLERADPPRSGRATPTRRVVGAIAWPLRVGGAWRALPPGWPPGLDREALLPRRAADERDGDGRRPRPRHARRGPA